MGQYQSSCLSVYSLRISHNRHSISKAAVAGISVSVILSLLVVGFCVFVRMRKRKYVSLAGIKSFNTSDAIRRKNRGKRTSSFGPGSLDAMDNNVTPRFNQFGPWEHLPPVVQTSSDANPVQDPFWDPSELLPPSFISNVGKGQSQSNLIPVSASRSPEYGAGLLGDRPVDPFADSAKIEINIMDFDAEMAMEERERSWITQPDILQVLNSANDRKSLTRSTSEAGNRSSESSYGSSVEGVSDFPLRYLRDYADAVSQYGVAM